MSEPVVTQTLKPKRTCGGCTLCCRVLSIEADDGSEYSPLDTNCPDCAIGQGCRIYASKPRSCEKFQCEWLRGAFAEDDRPDRSKIIVSFAPKTVMLHGQERLMPVLELKECAPGALDTPRGRRMSELARANPHLPVAFSPFRRTEQSRIELRGAQHRWATAEALAEFDANMEKAAQQLEAEGLLDMAKRVR